MTVENSLKLQFLNIAKPLVKNYVPRRYIFFIDVCIAFIAAQSAFFLINSATGGQTPILTFTWPLFAIVGIQALYFIILKSYFGVVRYSSFKDVITQLKVTALSVVTILVINRIYYLTLNEKLILDSGVIIFGFITFSLLFFFRLLVKRTYQSLNARKNSSNAYILGTDRADIAIGEGIISEHSGPFNILGFINLNDKKMLNRIHNLPIYSISQLKDANDIAAKSIIVSDETLQQIKSRNNSILAELLDLKLKIYKFPKIENYDSKTSFNSLKEIKIEDLLQRSPIKLNNLKLSALYKDKIILVTGAAGSIGSEIVKQLAPFAPKKIILLDQAETPLHSIALYLDKNCPQLNYEKVIANVRSKKRLRDVYATHHPQIVFHGAAYKHVPMMEANPIESLSVNFHGTRNLAELSTEFQIERFVFVSTDKAVNPTNIMGASKRAAEIFIQSLAKLNPETTFITTRFGNVLGSNGSVIPHFKKQIQEGGPVTVTHPDITRYFMTIDEACQLVLEAGGMGNGGEIYVFDMGSPIKIINLAHHMIRLTGLIPNKDIAIQFTGLRPGEKLFEELLADKETTLPTHHEKIMIAQATHMYDISQDSQLSELLKYVKQNNISDALKLLKRLVPEYQPIDLVDFKFSRSNPSSQKRTPYTEAYQKISEKS
ncbi:nucleoside-diphosphate sugar epimerase/dehydratase [Mesonia ostreae]|uniref:Nucleoside-diphosphate sugar epimerase/dehydratase n=1 Tax=Mesonia ostreae TaxID=861110 RepID=A0ABU2KH95_9FLAO|nr:nucleoside-diphosphate sugar epimerase/dehydratase [Mesonia ostreae]MDT0294085.1 nucleoside-diphosphate sugar epimerase/dehydratase [Mesonia ostreae]